VFNAFSVYYLIFQLRKFTHISRNEQEKGEKHSATDNMATESSTQYRKKSACPNFNSTMGGLKFSRGGTGDETACVYNLTTFSSLKLNFPAFSASY